MNENFKIFSSLLGLALFFYGSYGIFMSSSRELDLITGEICLMGFGFPLMAATMTESIKLQNIIGWILVGTCVYIFYNKPNILDFSSETMNFILIVAYVFSLGLVGVESNSDHDHYPYDDID